MQTHEFGLRDRVACAILQIDMAAWALWFEDGLPPGVYELRDKTLASADRVVALYEEEAGDGA